MATRVLGVVALVAVIAASINALFLVPPDVNQGDKAAATRFQQIQASYDVLRRSEERKAGTKL